METKQTKQLENADTNWKIQMMMTWWCVHCPGYSSNSFREITEFTKYKNLNVFVNNKFCKCMRTNTRNIAC